MSKLLGHEDRVMNDLRLVSLLACGDCGEVWLALSSSHELCAVKISEGQSIIEQEFATATQFEHPNILRPKTTFKNGDMSALVYPYCEGRSVDAVASYVSDTMLWLLARDVSSALCMLHQQQFVHGDIKPDHILWDGKKFLLSGFSTCHRESCMERSYLNSLSYRFTAPEAHKCYTAACDIWSLGATLFYLFMGCHVFNGLGGVAQHENSPLPYMRKTLPELSELVQQCLAYKPEQRPDAQFIHKLSSTKVDEGLKQSSVRAIKKVKIQSKQVQKVSFWPDEMIELQ